MPVISAPVCANIAMLKGLNPANYNTALTADGRVWSWKVGDYSTETVADVTNGVFAKADTVAATSGAWVVVTDGKVHSNWFGANGDRIAGADGVVTSGGKTYTSASANWSPADVGKVFVAHGAGAAGASLYATIASINSVTSVELTIAAGTSIASSGRYSYGTDNTVALQKWLDIAQMVNKRGYVIAWLDPGDHIVTGTIKGRGYVLISSPTERFSKIFPAMKSGAALSFDASSVGVDSGYHQVTEHIGIWGDDASGSAFALAVGGNTKHMAIQRNWFANFTSVNDGTYAVQFRGAGYNVNIRENHFLNNKRHYVCARTSGSGNFPTASIFEANIVEGGVEIGGTALLWQDTAGMIVRDNIIQANENINVITFYQTAAAETAMEPIIEGNWLEANSEGIANSRGIYVVSDDANSRVFGAKVRDNKFHGSDPTWKIELYGTDYARISGNTGGSGGYGVKRSGTNTNYAISGDGLAGTIDS